MCDTLRPSTTKRPPETSAPDTCPPETRLPELSPPGTRPTDGLRPADFGLTRGIEFAVIFLLLPGVLTGLSASSVRVPLFPVMWLMAGLAIWVLWRGRVV